MAHLLSPEKLSRPTKARLKQLIEVGKGIIAFRRKETDTVQEETYKFLGFSLCELDELGFISLSLALFLSKGPAMPDLTRPTASPLCKSDPEMSGQGHPRLLPVGRMLQK
jgi:hypothetical protein